MPCPVCHAPLADGSTTCGACGLVVARYDPEAHARVVARRQAKLASEHAVLLAARRNVALVAGFVMLLAALAVVWRSRDVPQQFSPPAGQVFGGIAHEYAGAGATLLLVGAEMPAVPVGRIEPDGRFRFELPAVVDLPRIPPAMLAQAAEYERMDVESGARHRAQVESRYATPASAVRRLAAGAGWNALQVTPGDINVGRFGIVYDAPGERGDLFPANSAMEGIAVPGDHMLVFVHADRDGTVRGEAIATNAFGVEVPNAWDLTLRKGWNLVISEQTAHPGRLAYRSGPLPDDLEWYAIDPRTRAVNLPRP
jgi:hypothetical protein